MYRLSRCVLLAHEDKLFQGALVASMSIPWGETKGGDADLGGYHPRLDPRSGTERECTSGNGQTERHCGLDLARRPAAKGTAVSHKIAG